MGKDKGRDKGKNKDKGRDKDKNRRVKGPPQQVERHAGSCPHFKFIDEGRIRSVFETKVFMKAISSNKPLSKNEIKSLQKMHKGVNWHKSGQISLCLTCGQAFDEKNVEEHATKCKNHLLFLSFNDRMIYCFKCDNSFPIEPKTLLAELLGTDEEEISFSPKARACGAVAARGLHNLGNSCWMNATLQVLSRLNLVPETTSPTTAPLSAAFYSLAKDLKTPGHALRPNDFVGHMLTKLSFLDVREQQDAYEFLMLFLDTMRDEMGGTGKNLSSDELSKVKTSLCTPIDQCVGFIINSQMQCEKCGGTRFLYQRTTILSICVPIGQPATLEECLKMHFSESSSSGDDWRCDNCGQIADCTIVPSFATIPKVLIIHLARFRISNYGYVKNNVKITVPLTLNTEEFGVKGEYELLGFITHHGTMEGGHYTSVFKDKSSFLYFDDSEVSTISTQEALSVQPYILFYSLKSDN